MKTFITFGEIAHREHTAKVVPLGISMVASYALKHFPDQIEVEIFKDGDEFLRNVEKVTPKIACFANYIWTENLSYQIAERIKKKNPDTIIIFGGPNYTLHDEVEQKKFLKEHPDIDFYIVGEGEVPFVLLLKELFKNNFNIKKIKEEKIKIAGCHYLIDGEFISSPMPPRIPNLDDIPSPYLLGLNDKFLNGDYKPLIETARGCPFACTFCQQGEDYYNKVRRFSFEVTKKELKYLAQKSKSKTLCLADSNFGTYKQDLVTANEMASLLKTYGFPSAVQGINGKNNKERVIETTEILGHTFFMAPIQSSNDEVLKNIKRKNISGQVMLDVVNRAKKKSQTATSYSELILGLPGETKESHLKANGELIDAGIDVVRSHQLIMLPASPMSYRKSRYEHGFVTKFRVVPDTIEQYELYGEKFYAPEIDEICVQTNTLSFDDYIECRKYNLTVETFYNNGIFEELIKLLKRYDIKISTFVLNIHEKVKNSKLFAELYGNFVRETKELWGTKEELIEFLKDKNVIKKYIAKNQNELSKNNLCSWKEVECLGACVNAPMMQINQDYYEDLNENNTEEIIKNLLEDKLSKPGSAKNRKNTAPEKGKRTLLEVKNA